MLGPCLLHLQHWKLCQDGDGRDTVIEKCVEPMKGVDSMGLVSHWAFQCHAACWRGRSTGCSAWRLSCHPAWRCGTHAWRRWRAGIDLHPVVVVVRPWSFCRQSHWHGRGHWTWGGPFASWSCVAGSWCLSDSAWYGNVEADVSGFDEVNSDLMIDGEGAGGRVVRHCREQRGIEQKHRRIRGRKILAIPLTPCRISVSHRKCSTLCCFSDYLLIQVKTGGRISSLYAKTWTATTDSIALRWPVRAAHNHRTPDRDPPERVGLCLKRLHYSALCIILPTMLFGRHVQRIALEDTQWPVCVRTECPRQINTALPLIRMFRCIPITHHVIMKGTILACDSHNGSSERAMK